MSSAGAKPSHSGIQPPQSSKKSATAGARATGDRREESLKRHFLFSKAEGVSEINKRSSYFQEARKFI